MSQINNQPLANPVQISDLVVLWSQSEGDTRRAALSVILALFQAQIQQSLDSISIFCPFVGGSANALTVQAAAAVVMPAPFLGQRLYFLPVVNNTGPATVSYLDEDGVTITKSIYKNGAALANGDMLAGVPVEVCYDGTQFSLFR